ncbi:hypothetical protein J6590_050104 [Homalodisca vitripennis]|nr:hypothetical protein J6590_050104 [Homalodisca vitripennis]
MDCDTDERSPVYGRSRTVKRDNYTTISFLYDRDLTSSSPQLMISPACAARSRLGSLRPQDINGDKSLEFKINHAPKLTTCSAPHNKPKLTRAKTRRSEGNNCLYATVAGVTAGGE